MIGCPQCGAEVTVSDQELRRTCSFCSTPLLLDGDRPARHRIVPATASRRQLLQAIRDRLAHSDGTSDAEGEPELPLLFFPYRQSVDGSFAPAFQSHVQELLEFRVPGSDWKIFHPDLVPEGAVLLEPSTDREEGVEAILHYPFVRAAVRLGGEEIVLWLDASRGVVVAGEVSPFRAAARRLPPRVLGVATLAYFSVMLLLPFPWSLGAALAGTPLLHRWGMRQLTR